jgi:hypothetical protein
MYWWIETGLISSFQTSNTQLELGAVENGMDTTKVPASGLLVAILRISVRAAVSVATIHLPRCSLMPPNVRLAS